MFFQRKTSECSIHIKSSLRNRRFLIENIIQIIW
eukprot:UN25371